MASKSIVIILGAGASFDVGYPLGTGLKTRILRGLEDGPYNLDALKAGYSREDVNEFHMHFRDCGLLTIDEFLAENIDLRGIGKFLITRDINSCESEEELMQKGQACWYGSFRRQLGRGLDNLADSNVKICTFNYDRSLKHFLWKTYLAVARQTIAQERLKGLLGNLGFVPLHGSLPALGWQGGTGSCLYGEMKEMASVKTASHGILTPDEAVDLQHNIYSPRDLIQSADQVFFLGFGFDQLNMAKLGMLQFVLPTAYVHPKHGHKFNASSVGLSDAIKAQLGRDYNMRFFESIDAIMTLWRDFGF